MRASHWVAIFAVGTLLSAGGAAVLATQKSDESDGVRTAAAKNNPGLPGPIRESQLRPQAPAGAPASPAPQRVETTKYDSWVVVCQEGGAAAKKVCAASLRAMGPDQNARQPLLTWELGSNKDGHFVTIFHVPPAIGIKKDNRVAGGPILIPNGVELKFGNGAARRISYLWCGPQQCVAEALIDDAFVKEALANTKATVTVYTFGGEAIPLELPITGIDKAISSTRK